MRAAQPTEVDQQARLPSVRDPKLYLVKVKLGKERETVICLMQKAKSMLEQPGMAPLDILSAAAQDHLKGFIYIEADRKPHVRAALKGLRNVYHSFEPQLVPIPEMVPSISVVQKAVAKVSAGSWVRLRAGVYKGDLARVLSVSTADNAAVVRLVPRFDLAALAAAEARRGRGDPADKADKAARKARPPQRLFSAAEANIHGLPVEERRDRSGLLDTFELLAGVHKFKDGYYIRSVALSSCRPEPQPPFDELQRFAGAETAGGEAGGDAAGAAGVAALAASLGGNAENAGAAAANGSYQGPAVVFAPGDSVIVIAPGDLHNLTGVVESVAAGGEEVRVAPRHEELAGTLLPFKPRELAKYFLPGSHCRVTAGAHDGATGLVVRADADAAVAVLLTDVLREEIKVFMRDLVDASDANAGDASLGGFSLFDLVLLEDGVAGVIVAVAKEAAVVLTHNGPPDRPELRTCRAAQLCRKLPAERASAQDANMNAVTRGDAVRIQDGPARGCSGVVEWAHRGYLFVRCREVMDNAGMLCVRARSAKVAGAPGGGGGAGAGAAGVLGRPGFAGPSPALALRSPAHAGGLAAPMGVPRSPRLPPGSAALLPPSAGGMGAPRPGMGPPGGAFTGGRTGRRDDALVGQRVLVRSGAYKGYRGVVLDATEAIVRLELEANEKTVTIGRVHVDPAGAAALPPRMAEMSAQTPGRDMYGRTPVHLGNATPMRDPTMTPGREAFGATPARANPWDARGGTPSRGGFTPGDWAAPPTDAYGSMQPFGGQRLAGTPGAPTPGSALPGTPGFGRPGVAPSPYGMPVGGTPVGGTPAMAGTPATPIVDTGLLTGSAGGSERLGAGAGFANVWAQAGLVVRLKAGGGGSGSGVLYVIRSVAPDGRVLLEALGAGDVPTKAETAVRADDFEMVQPTRGHRLRVISGEHIGTTGRIAGAVVDGEVAVYIDGGKEGDVSFFDQTTVCRML